MGRVVGYPSYLTLTLSEVEKGNTCENAANSVAGIARAIYERTFRIIADKCNEVSYIGVIYVAIFDIFTYKSSVVISNCHPPLQTLCDPKMKRVSYIGVLDIAGFEIFGGVDFI